MAGVDAGRGRLGGRAEVGAAAPRPRRGTAASFAGLSDHLVRRHLNVVGLQTAYELRGVSCVPLDEAPVSRQTIIWSRSFGEPVSDHA